MINSMTAFGGGKSEQSFGSVTVELRSVNSRFLDIQFRLPDELRLVEQPIKEKLTAELSRGKVEVRAHFNRAQSAVKNEVSVDGLQLVAQQLERARKYLPETASPSLTEILSLLSSQQPQTDPELWMSACQEALNTALAELLAGRRREGHRLSLAMLEDRKSVV